MTSPCCPHTNDFMLLKNYFAPSKSSFLAVMTCGIGFLLLVVSADAAEKPLKVFVLAGQSNMDGQADVRTLDFLGEDRDPDRASLLGIFKSASGALMTRKDVWVANAGVYGELQAGFGGRRNYDKLGSKIGPEYAFGYYMGEVFDEQVLLIKYAPGGKSLHVDFRPPSAGNTGNEKLDTKAYIQSLKLQISELKSTNTNTANESSDLSSEEKQRCSEIVTDFLRLTPESAEEKQCVLFEICDLRKTKHCFKCLKQKIIIYSKPHKIIKNIKNIKIKKSEAIASDMPKCSEEKDKSEMNEMKNEINNIAKVGAVDSNDAVQRNKAFKVFVKESRLYTVMI